MKPTYSPKFISTIAALSLCVSSAVAHHPQVQVPEAKGKNNTNKWIAQNGISYENKHLINGQTVTINNDGKPVWGMLKVQNSGGTLQSLITKGTINGANQVIFIESGKNVYVPTITNEGKILGNNNNTYKDRGAIEVQAGTIANFANQGTIEAHTGHAIHIGSNATMTLTNTGLIKALGHVHNNTNGHQQVHVGDGDAIHIWGNNAKIINNGTIESNNRGVNFQNTQSHNSNHTLENSGLIKAKNAAVFIGAVGTNSNTNKNGIDLLKNTGTLISDNSHAIEVYNCGSSSDCNNNATAGIKTLENSGLIKGKENGIYIEYRHGNQSSIGTIDNTGTITAEKGAGIKIANSGGQQAKITGQIKVNGVIQGKTAGIINEGQLGSSANQDVIVIGSNGKIEGGIVNSSNGKGGSISGNIVNNSNSDLRITNNDKASLKGNITNNGTGTLAIDNKGTVGNNTVIKNNGSGGSIKILDWKLENQNNGGNGNLKTVKFEGKNITLDKLTINAQNIDITKVANAFSTGNDASKASIFANTQVKVSGDNGAVTITGDLLRGLVANIDGSKTAAAALNRTLIATATARATFLDTVM
ncbi:MAG: hypothetical protein MR629_05035, partial [Helicobacter sp.]|nr:hypothetical protein [Helicobacter sp.]